MLNKPIFKFLKDRYSTDNNSDQVHSEGEGNEQDLEKMEKKKQKIEITKVQLQRNTLRPPIAYGYNQAISQAKGYSSLNENERYVVEKLGLLPESFLMIKKKIIEKIWMEGKIDPPNIPNGRHEGFWYSLERYVKTYPENPQNHFRIIGYVGKSKLYMALGVHLMQTLQKVLQ